jgi:hypothetical protein
VAKLQTNMQHLLVLAAITMQSRQKFAMTLGGEIFELKT